MYKLLAGVIVGGYAIGALWAHAETQARYDALPHRTPVQEKYCNDNIKRWEDGSIQIDCSGLFAGDRIVFDPDGSAERDPITGVITRDPSTIGWHWVTWDEVK